MGSTGLRPPVIGASSSSNFVFWIGLAHSGTLISAILYLFRARFRTSINRRAEAMTMICIVIAGSYPLDPPREVWIFYWLIPYPESAAAMARFRLAPDLRLPRRLHLLHREPHLLVHGPRPRPRRHPGPHQRVSRRKIYGYLRPGWTGSHRQWHHYATSYLLLAGLATALVISVHTVVSWDFALPIQPGWHSTIFPPYFVAGAIHSGLAMVLTLLIPMRRIFRIAISSPSGPWS